MEWDSPPSPALLPSLRLLCLHFHKRTQPLPAPPPQSTGSLAQDSRASTQPALAEHLLRARTLPGAQGSVRSRRHSPWGVHVGGAGGPKGTRAGSYRPPASLSHGSVRHAGKRFGGFLNDQTPVSPRTPGWALTGNGGTGAQKAPPLAALLSRAPNWKRPAVLPGQ